MGKITEKMVAIAIITMIMVYIGGETDIFDAWT